MAGPYYEKGVYTVECIGTGTGTVASSGNPQILLRVMVLSICDQSQPDTEYDVEQNERTLFLTVTEKTQDRILKNLRDAGWRDASFDKLDTLVGARFHVECQHEVRQKTGQLGEKWDFPRGDLPPLINDQNVTKKLNALFGAKLKATAPATPPAHSTPLTRASDPVPPTAAQLEDEVPF
jgi:hypothetical protein